MSDTPGNGIGFGKKAIVIGGGITGLSTASLLAREGYAVTLLEKQPEIGGRSGMWETQGFRFDTGPSWYLMPEVFDHFFKLMGTSADEQLNLTLLDPGYRVFFEGDDAESIDILADHDSNVALFESIEPGAGLKITGYLDSAKETYDLAKKYFLYSTFQDFRPLFVKPVLKRTLRLVRLLLESLNSFAGRVVKDARLRQVLGYPAVFLGSSPFQTPSMYHLMSHLDLTDGVLYPQGGLYEVIDSIHRIAVDAGVDIRTSATVTRIVMKTDAAPAAVVASDPAAGLYDYDTAAYDTSVIDRDELKRMLAEGVGPVAPAAASAQLPAEPVASGLQNAVGGVHYTDENGRAHSLEADVVVSAADLRHTETTLLLPELQTYPESYWEKKTAGPSAVLVYLGISGSLPELAHHSLFFIADWKENFSRIFGRGRFGSKIPTSVPDPASIYVCRPSATDATVAPEGHENLFILVPIPADPGIGRGGLDGNGGARVEKIADDAIAQIAKWAKIPDLAERIVVRRTTGPGDFAADLNSWKGTALGPAHTLTQSAFFRAGNVSKKVDGLLYAGYSTIPGIGLPMCLISAELVIKRLRGDVTPGALAEPSVVAAAAAE
jgi:phytoene dehydrogenase-like protein